MANILQTSIFGNYRKKEDVATDALLHILQYGGTDLIEIVFRAIGIVFKPLTYSISTQVRSNAVVLDGLIEADYNFKLIIECKINSAAFRKVQLYNHIANAMTTKSQLLYLTHDHTRPNYLKQYPKILWTNWDAILATIDNYAQVNEDKVLIYLAHHLDLFVNSYNNIRNNYDVVIVGGSNGEDIAQTYKFYICQAGRYFHPSIKYIAFYHANRIKEIFEIDKIVGEYENLNNIPEIASTNYLISKDPNYDGSPRKVFLLKDIANKNNLNIINNTVDKNGKPCAFVQRQCYTTYSKIMSAKKTSDLK